MTVVFGVKVQDGGHFYQVRLFSCQNTVQKHVLHKYANVHVCACIEGVSAVEHECVCVCVSTKPILKLIMDRLF